MAVHTHDTLLPSGDQAPDPLDVGGYNPRTSRRPDETYGGKTARVIGGLALVGSVAAVAIACGRTGTIGSTTEGGSGNAQSGSDAHTPLTDAEITANQGTLNAAEQIYNNGPDHLLTQGQAYLDKTGRNFIPSEMVETSITSLNDGFRINNAVFVGNLVTGNLSYGPETVGPETVQLFAYVRDNQIEFVTVQLYNPVRDDVRLNALQKYDRFNVRVDQMTLDMQLAQYDPTQPASNMGSEPATVANFPSKFTPGWAYNLVFSTDMDKYNKLHNFVGDFKDQNATFEAYDLYSVVPATESIPGNIKTFDGQSGGANLTIADIKAMLANGNTIPSGLTGIAPVSVETNQF